MQTSARLAQFYQDYRHSMTALSYRLTGSWSEAEDIVQEVFAELQQNVLADSIRQPKSYLMRAVVNRSLSALKSPRMSRELYTGHGYPNLSSIRLQRRSWIACCGKSKSLTRLWFC
ncbi:MAG: sigma factor [Paenibacillus sp.]|uniref:sigma factor n=1 Tax=Paenibacillus sp. TaxID=58172 RepID=UPI0028FE6E53|nr:sigma factor [Paenibacillus sp.]MDU2238987.1 sigma factor [Paenibacillus sp.]